MKTENIMIKIIALILEEKLVFNEFLSSKKALDELEFLKVELLKNLEN
ncbi:MAG: hypothetical protein GXX85_14330 [Ignavibacteria bacterium]|jgi:hypothetical protein|nr:hypothetical protein [Ignavibacteria bacterium]